MPKPRVLLITPDFPPSTGGIAVLMESLVAHATGWETRILTFGQPGDAAWDAAASVAVRRVSSTEIDRRLAVALLNAAALREIAAFRPDVLLVGHVVAGIAAAPVARLLRKPLVLYVHADEFRTRAKLTARATRRADATIAVSSYTREMALGVGAAPLRVHLIPPGVVVPPPPAGQRDPRPTILTVASLLSERKGHDVIASALPLVRERIPDARWVVIGDGPLRPRVEAAVADAGVGDAVSLLGRVDDATRDGWLDRARVFCMPSRVPPGGLGGEGFGIVYLEAGAHELPVVAGNVAGALDAVVDDETGILVDPTDHRAVATALIRVLTDPELASRMGEAGRRHAEEHAWPRIAARVEALVEEVRAGGGAAM
ncbi:MAG TPA: glycosyltransferase family 4 protein [Solirubrobacterales bacterium]|nr:glycosyltransferase family 4 protein [Solirubrobacterales bacterium]